MEAAVEIIKPRNDEREYRRVVLPNSLQVLLISDPETDKCAASMNVGVGSFSDPKGLEGLAHFLEHMLFYASEKYPLEDSYSKYITEHGGSTNAFTSSQQTNYHFDVNADCFEEALDRFAQFFHKPLMSDDATTREIKAVDSENQKNLLSDSWRMDQLQRHLSAENHPYHKFSTGNWDTLEVKPKARGVNTREELFKFYEENYSSNLMYLVVYAKDSLDKIGSQVQEKFQDIQNTDNNCAHFPGQPCSPEYLQILVKTVPIKQGHELSIIWPYTPDILYYKEGVSTYLSHLIGHEGEGSLFYTLKKLGWATSLYAGESDSTREFSFFKVDIDITDAGNEHFEDITALLFKYIRLLQQSGICNWIFAELSAICETDFHYQDKIDPIDYVVNVAYNMQMYPPEDWLTGSSLPSTFNPANIQLRLNELSPDSVRIFWKSTKFEGHTDKTEPWYGTAYSIEKITREMIEQWIERAPDEHLHLPIPNVFIATDLTLKNGQEKEARYPILLRNSTCSRLWYKPDTAFYTPKAYVMVDFNCPFANKSPEGEMLTSIFTCLLMDYLNEYAYNAQVAGLYYGVNCTNNGFQVSVGGYNHKLRILLETVIEKIATFEVKPDRFSVIKELITKEHQNFKFEQPYQQAKYYCLLILQDQTWSWNDALEVLPHLEADDLTTFYPLMLSRTFIECYVAGNIEPIEAELMVQHVENVFFKGHHSISGVLFPSQHIAHRVTKLDRATNYFYTTEGMNPNDDNSAFVHYIQVHQDDLRLNVKLELFSLIAKQPAFHQLRSVEQLGYITMLRQRNDFGVRGVQFIIQSTQKGPRHIDRRVEAFLKMFESILYGMSNDEFKSHVSALIDMKLEKHKNLYEESAFYWHEVYQGTLKFDRVECEVEALTQLTQKELIDFFDEHIKVGAPLKKSLSVHVYGRLHVSEYKDNKNEPLQANSVQIEDIFSFKRSRPLYGSIKGGSAHMEFCRKACSLGATVA